MKHIEDLRDMLCEELEKFSKKGSLTAGSLETIDKLAHAIKSIDTIMAMEEYSEDDGYYDDGYSRSYSSYARGRGRNARRNSNGRYSRKGSYDMGYSGHESLNEELSELMENVSNDRDRMVIKKVMDLMQKEE